MFKFLKGLFSSQLAIEPPVTEAELATFTQIIHEICDSVEKKNLTYVNDTIESTSGHNNYKLVKSAAYFVKECVWTFNTHYASEFSKNDYFKEFVIYFREIEHGFEDHYYDPDGVGGGTLTDIIQNIGD